MDDVTIEDELDENEQVLSQSKNSINQFKWFSIFELLNQQWMIILLLSTILILIFIYIKRKGKEKHISYSNEDLVNRYEQIERIRQKQQEQYQEQVLRREQEKKQKMELLKSSTDENSDRFKYRTNDHNPLTGQSSKGTNDSCSWRPSSSRRKPAGG